MPEGLTLVALIVRLRERWRRGERLPVEQLLAEADFQPDDDTLLDLIYNEILLREQAGESPQLDDYLPRFPHLTEALRLQFEVEGALTDEPQSSESFPDCEILGELGRGATGVVYRAWQRGPKRIVALKLLSDAVPRARARTEAEAAARLQHPHLVQIFEVKEHAGRTCLVLEYVEGSSLAKRIEGKPQPPRAAAELVATLARAMAYAHEKGVVHRDLKPGNVLMAGSLETPLAQCDPKISDFGLAKLVGPESGPELTRTTDILGTPSYMAPEQAGDGKAVGPLVDVYALGAILYELLTGRPPFLGETILDTLTQVRTQEPVPPRRLQPKVPRDLEIVCLKCLHKDPRRRYPSATALAEDLDRFLDGRAIRARSAGPLERTLRWARRRPTAAALIAVTVSAILALLLGGLYFARQIQRQRDLAESRADQLDQQLQQTRRLLFTAQLLRVGAVWERDPLHGQQLLEDPHAFPTDLRDFSWAVLYGQCRRYRQSLEGHDRRVSALAFQPGQPLLASGGHDGRVLLWDTNRGTRRHRFHEHTNRITALDFSSSGALASGSYDGTILLWDPVAGKVTARLRSPDGPVGGVAFGLGGRILSSNAGTGRYGVTLLWDVEKKQVRRRLPWRSAPRAPVTVSPDGKMLACVGADRTVRLWDLAADEERRPLRGLEAQAGCLAFGPDGTTLAAGCDDGSVRLWDVTAGVFLTRLEGDGGAVTGVAFARDGRTLAVACENRLDRASLDTPRAVLLFDLKTNTLLDPLKGHRGAVTALAFSADGATLATGGSDATVRLWDVIRRPDRLSLDRHVTRPGSFALLAEPGKQHLRVAWISRQPGSAARPIEISTWDLSAGRAGPLLRGHRDPILCLAASPDGTRLASAAGGDAEPAELFLWDVRTGTRTGRLFGPPGRLQALAFSPDGKQLAAANWERLVLVWDLRRAEPRYVLSEQARPVTCLAWSADGKRLASGEDQTGEKGGIKVWDLDTGQVIQELAGHGDRVHAVAFSPDGRSLASGGADGKARIWDLETGEERFTLDPGDREVTALAYTPDGECLATGGTTPIVRLWDARMGQERVALPGHVAGVSNLTFTPDGQILVVSNQSRMARLWYARKAVTR